MNYLPEAMPEAKDTMSVPIISFGGKDTNKTLSYQRSTRRGPLQSSNQNRTLPSQLPLVRNNLSQFDVGFPDIQELLAQTMAQSNVGCKVKVREYEFDLTALNTTTMPQLGAQLVNTNGADESEITSEEEEKTVSKLKQQARKMKKSSKNPKREQQTVSTHSSPKKKNKHDKTQTEKKPEATAKGESLKAEQKPKRGRPRKYDVTVPQTVEPSNATCDPSFYDSYMIEQKPSNTQPKPKRGRPRKYDIPVPQTVEPSNATRDPSFDDSFMIEQKPSNTQPKPKRGRPRKYDVPVPSTVEPVNSTYDPSFYDSFKVGPNQTLDTGKYVHHVFDDSSCESDSDEENVTVIKRTRDSSVH